MDSETRGDEREEDRIEKDKNVEKWRGEKSFARWTGIIIGYRRDSDEIAEERRKFTRRAAAQKC